MLSVLRSFRAGENDYLFTGSDRHMEPRTMQYRFQKFLKELGISHRNFHILRHSFATRCIDCGMDIKSLSEILGHANVQVTLQMYVHPSMDSKRSALEAASVLSGMYTVNGSHPEVGVAAKYLKDGDNIVLHYTDDYDYEEGGNKYGQKPSGGTTTGGTTGTTTGGTSMISAADRNKAVAVDKLIEKIGTVTKDSGPAIEAARKAYNGLTPTQKRLVTKLKELTDAEKAYAKLTATAEDQQKAKDVIDKISKIGNVTKDSEQDIKDARKAYDALTDLQKLLVDNYETLTAAETKFAMLDTLGKVSEPYISTGDYMEELGTPNVGAIGGEWMVIGLARSGRTVPGVEDYYQKAVEYVQSSIDPDTGRLHKAKSTDNSRMILALTAIGKDVTNVGGYNLLAGLSDLEFVKYQGNNGPIWALLALDCGNYPAPNGGTTTRQALIDELLRVQTSDGGWTISGDRADSDMTGMALTALAPYYKKDPTVKQAIDKAIARLSEMQDDDGGFSTTYGDGKYIATSESTAQVLTALSALGIDGGHRLPVRQERKLRG